MWLAFLHHNPKNLYSGHVLILYFAQYVYRFFFFVAFGPEALLFCSPRIIVKYICIRTLNIESTPFLVLGVLSVGIISDPMIIYGPI